MLSGFERYPRWVPKSFWAFQTRATFWAIFNKFPLVPRLHFAFCAKIFLSLCIISGYNLEDNAICARVLLGLFSEGYFLGDF